MATFELASADGAKYQVEAPDEATAISAFNAQMGHDGGSAQSSLGFQPTAPRTGSKLLDTFDAAMRSAGNMVSFGMADRLAAAMNPGSYADNLKKERETNAFDRQNNAGAAFAGDVGGALLQAGALPAKLMQITATTVAGRIAQGAGQGAVLGAAQGAGQSTSDTLTGKLGDAASMGLMGAGLGGAVGGIIRPPSGAPAPTPPAGRPNIPVAEAAQRQGIDLPLAMATDSQAIRGIGSYVQDMPFIGTPLQSAHDTAVKQTQAALARVATGLGKADPVSAGEGIQGAITRYAKTELPEQMAARYGAVPGMDSPVTVPMNALRDRVAQIAGERANANLSGLGGAVEHVADAVRAPGMNARGIQKLRSSLGEKMTGAFNPNMSQSELKAIYGPVTEDLKAAIRAGGGDEGVRAFEAANAFTAAGKRRVDMLEGLARGNVAPEAALARVHSMLLEGGRGNIKRVLDIKKVMSPQEWGDASASILHNLGKSTRTGEFSPDVFVSNWGKMSQSGKRVLVNGDHGHMQAVNDIYKTAKAIQDYSRGSNKSRSGVVATISGTTAGLMTAPITTLASVLGGRAVSMALSKPVTASALANYSKAYQRFVTNPTTVTLGGVTRRAGVLSEVMAKELGVPANDVGRATIGHLRAVAESEQKPTAQE